MNHLKNEWFLGFATSIRERISVLPQDEYTGNQDGLMKWRQRKTLITDSEFDVMLKHYNLSTKDFNLGITPLTERSLKKLFEFVQTQRWYKIHKEVFSVDTAFQPTGLEVALRFHVEYYLADIHRQLAQGKDIKFEQSSIASLKEHFISELLVLANRTLVWDVHDIKERLSLKETDSKKAFTQYLQLRFGSHNDTELFFLEYPTLARLLAERLSYAIQNFKKFIQALTESADNLARILHTTKPFLITKWHPQTGDSHNKGKTTTLLEINHIPLAFKYHNNDVLITFNQFLSYLEEKAPQYQFYKVACISGADYCFEEFIKHESCIDISEIKQYYKNYGALVAITYWLGATDLHMENLIAKGVHPVLIDVETLLRPEESRIYAHGYTKNNFFEVDSVITSGLLPMSKYWKRQIDVSALNGTEQKLPFSVRKLVNENTSDMIYQLEDAYLPTAKNLPFLNDLPTHYKGYEVHIMDGYREILALLKANKEEVFKILEALFHKLPLRVILRDTQDYQNFLDFSTHPSCMVDYIEREKIFENIWNNAFSKQEIIKHEVTALLNHDVPYFYTNTHSLNIHTDETTILNFYTKNMLKVLREHINNMTDDTTAFSFLLLQESLSTLSVDIREIDIPQNNLCIKNSYLRKASDIADYILANVRVDNVKNRVAWAEVAPDDTDAFILEYPEQNLYNGTSGLFLFFYFMNQLNPTIKYSEILYTLECEVFYPTSTKQQHYSAFYGAGARLTVAFVTFRYKKEDKYFKLMLDNLQLIFDNIKHYNSWDWIYGKSSLICILSRIYEECAIPLVKNIMEKLTENISIPEGVGAGFAHGYSGILYALMRSNSVLQNTNIEKKIQELYQILLESLEHNSDLNSSWCRGSTGINKALSEFHTIFSSSNPMVIPIQKASHPQNSCLCHGAYGRLSLLIEKAELSKSSIEEILVKPIFLSSNHDLVPLGLFTGLSGLGLQLLKVIEPRAILDILYL